MMLNLYCPLLIQTEDEDSCYLIECDNKTAIPYEDVIRKALVEEMKRGNGADMATYFTGSNSIKDKIISAKWDVENVEDVLYGCIHTEVKEPLTEDEMVEWKDYILGQNSDGFGEGFEQRPIKTADENLYISFWNSDDDYFIYNQDEFDNHISNGDMTMGGL
ncbi:MAG: hypothetical protein ACYCWE_00065 [Eubacteriales bacterium]